jgi:hypothetical protein
MSSPTLLLAFYTAALIVSYLALTANSFSSSPSELFLINLFQRFS